MSVSLFLLCHTFIAEIIFMYFLAILYFFVHLPKFY